MLNSITIMGRLTKDPELRTTQTGKHVASFTLAVDRDYDRETTDFFSCNAWDKTAEFIDTHFKKGQMMVVQGRMYSRTYTDRNGNNRTAWEVTAINVYFGDSKKATADVQFEELADDVPLPF